MEEDKQDTNWADILHQKNIEMEQRDITQGSTISKLIANQLVRYEPTNKDTSQKAYNRQEQLACDEIEQIEDGHAKQLLLTPCS